MRDQSLPEHVRPYGSREKGVKRLVVLPIDTSSFQDFDRGLFGVFGMSRPIG